MLVKKGRDRQIKKEIERERKLREERQQEKLLRREKTDDLGSQLEMKETAKRELIIDRPFMYVLKCDDSVLQIGRYSSNAESNNRDISNRITNKKFVRQ